VGSNPTNTSQDVETLFQTFSPFYLFFLTCGNGCFITTHYCLAEVVRARVTSIYQIVILQVASALVSSLSLEHYSTQHSLRFRHLSQNLYSTRTVVDFFKKEEIDEVMKLNCFSSSVSSFFVSQTGLVSSINIQTGT